MMSSCINAIIGGSQKVDIVSTETVVSALPGLWSFSVLSKITTEFLKWSCFQKLNSQTHLNRWRLAT